MLQQNSCGNTAMPLLMGFTPLTKIQEGGMDAGFIYDDNLQTTKYDMATIGTKCLKQHTTKKVGGSLPDKKNEIDDSKTK